MSLNMAPFLSRLFKKQTNKPKINDFPLEKDERFSIQFHSAKQVRMLLFRERYGHDRRLLFDSKAVRKKEDTSMEDMYTQAKLMKENSFEKSFKLNSTTDKDLIYVWQKQSSDEQMLREMVFGSVTTSYQGIAMKVHTIRCPLQVMISLVYPAPTVAEFRTGEFEESGNSSSSACDILITKNMESELIHLAHSVPVNVPSHFSEYRTEGKGSFESLDGYTGLPAYLNPKNEFCKLRQSLSYNNLQRRLLRSKATSIQLGLKKTIDETNDIECSSVAKQSRVKLGLCLVISLAESQQEERDFQSFFFTHIAIFENHLMELRTIVNAAYLNRKRFLQLLFEGSKKLQAWIQDLYTAPRLQFPEWLTIITSSNHHELSNIFMQKFGFVLKEYDTKETNFFVSTLLTTVLTHHLAWVPTVVPTDAKNSTDLRIHKHVPLWVSVLAKSRPYNPLWVQLGDLYGSISKLSKITKIVVKGSKNNVILVFLQVLSYFMRCSDICEQVFERKQSYFDENGVFSQRYPSPTANSSPFLYKSFGWSLMASVSDHYLKDFCLQGVNGHINDEEISQDLCSLSQLYVLGEPVTEAVCILVDTDKWTVNLQSSNWPETENGVSGSNKIQMGMSCLISNICESVLSMKQLGLPSESCIVYLEDKLQELYCHSLKLNEYVRHNKFPSSLEKIASALHFDLSDMPLLLAVAITHSPNLSVFKL